MITEQQVQEALDWMITNEDKMAVAKAAYHDLDRFSKTVKAELMSKLSGNMSVSARETEALANEEYKTHLDNLRLAEETYLKFEYKMDHNKLICQLWQTISANRRQSIQIWYVLCVKTNQEHLIDKNDLSPESLLWVSVLMQAFHDARVDFNYVKIFDAPEKKVGPKFRVTDSDGYALSQVKLKAFYECIIARLWFEQQDEQYQFVCSLAGLEYDYVYRIYKNILEDDGIDPVDMLKRFMKN